MAEVLSDSGADLLVGAVGSLFLRHIKAKSNIEPVEPANSAVVLIYGSESVYLVSNLWDDEDVRGEGGVRIEGEDLEADLH